MRFPRLTCDSFFKISSDYSRDLPVAAHRYGVLLNTAEMIDIMWSLMSAFAKSLLIYHPMPSLSLSCSLPPVILIKLVIGRCFSNKKLMVQAFPLMDLNLGFAICGYFHWASFGKNLEVLCGFSKNIYKTLFGGIVSKLI